MKLGKAKIDAGVPPAVNEINPHDGGPRAIEKGRIYEVPDDYDFKHKQAWLEPYDEKKTKKPEVKDGS